MADTDIDILIRAKDLASRTIRGVKGELGSLDGVGSKAARNLTTNLIRVGAVGAVGLAAGVTSGARSLAHLERVTNLTNATLESTKGVSGQTAQSIRDHAQALEQLTTADDKAIQEGQNMLLTFTQIGKETFPAATEAVVNLAIAMAKGDVANADFKGSALQVGKALNDPVKGITALRRAGIQFTKDQEKQIKTLVKSGDLLGAQAIILGELETQFGKAGEAAGKGFEADLRRVQDAGEDATMALAKGVMPMLTRAATWLQTKLADPRVLRALEDLGVELGNAMGAALDFVESIDFAAIGKGLGVAKDAAKAIVSTFLSLPPWVQTAVVTGWGLNKLTGGALGDVVGALGSGLIKGVLGMNAGVVNINAAAVRGGGLPIPGVAGAAGAAGAGAVATGLAFGAAAIGVIGAFLVQQDQSNKNTSFSQDIRTGLDASVAGKTLPELRIAMQGVDAGINELQSNPLYALVQGEALDNLKAMKATLASAIESKTNALGGQSSQDNDPDKRSWRNQKEELIRIREMVNRSKDDTVSGLDRARDAALETKREAGRGLAIVSNTTRSSALTNASIISSSIARNRAVQTTNVVVNVTASSVTKSVTTSNRYGGTGASRSTDPNAAQPV